MPKAKLDHAFCLLARCEEGKRKTDWYDEAVTGFVLECRASGGKTYYLRYDQDGRQKQIKLAAYGDAPFAQVRRKAEKLRSEVVLGEDIAAKKAAARAVPTYAELAAQHLADAKLHQRSYDTTEMYIRRHLLPRFGKLRINEIDSRMVAVWLASKQEAGLAPATCEKLRVLLGRAYSLAEKWGLPGAEKNPARGLPRKPLNNARERFLTAEEASRLREAVTASKNKQLRFIVDWLLYTGCRLRECLDARWEHVDIQQRRWLVPMSKNGRSRTVPMSNALLAVAADMPRFAKCPWLVPNPDTKQPFVSVKHAWQTARDEAGLPGLRLHDLRHAFSSFAINNGVDLLSLGRLIGHSSYQSTQRYAHLANETLIAAVEAGAAKQALPTA